MALPKGVSDLEAVTLLTPRVHDAVEEDMGVPLGLEGDTSLYFV
jgi:hypothetical protein